MQHNCMKLAAKAAPTNQESLASTALRRDAPRGDNLGENRMVRTILAVLAGAVVMWLTVFAMEFVGHAMFPPPPHLNPNDPTQLAELINVMPIGAKVMLVLAWVLGAFTGGAEAAAGGITAAVFFGWLAAVLFRPEDKS